MPKQKTGDKYIFTHILDLITCNKKLHLLTNEVLIKIQSANRVLTYNFWGLW